MNRSLLSLLIIVMSTACGGDESTTDTSEAPTVFGTGETENDSGEAGTMPLGPSTALKMSYTKTVSPSDGSTEVVDLLVYDFGEGQEYNLTAGNGVVKCVRRCLINKSMTWVGWLEQGAGDQGTVLKVAPIDANQNVVNIDAVRDVATQVSDFSFTTYIDPTTPTAPGIEQVVYTRGESSGVNENIEMFVEPIAGSNCEEGMGGADCRNLAGTINSEGAFRVTDLSSLLIVVETTLSTMTLSFFNLASTAVQEIFTFGEANQTGSQYSGRNPIGLAPDASYIAVFTDSDFTWRLNIIDARPGMEPLVHDLFPLRNRPDTCSKEGNYAYTDVIGDPVFSTDSQWIYFLVKGDCSGGNRTDYDVVRINRTNLDAGLESVTRVWHVNFWVSHQITSYALSPDGDKLAFTGQRPNDELTNSIWVVDPASGDYDCSRGTPASAIDESEQGSRQRCEFISDPRSDSRVQYRDIRFHRG